MPSQNDTVSTISEADATPTLQAALEELERFAADWIRWQRRKAELASVAGLPVHTSWRLN